MEIWPGRPYPLGATFDGTGTNFGLFSEVAERVELCLIGERGGETRIADAGGGRLRLALLPADGAARTAVRLPGARARTTRATALACNPNKLLLDPYAKAVSGLDRLGSGTVLLRHGRARTHATTRTPGRT